MENKQTAVEWLEQEFIKLESTIGVYGVMYELLEQAKKMERKQIEEAADESLQDEIKYWYEKTGSLTSEDIVRRAYSLGITEGAKWMQEDIIEKLEMHILINEHDWNRNPQAQFRDFVEQIKKR